MRQTDSYDVVVIGAGVFGVWTAYLLQRLGASVAFLDAYGPGNSRASSGGESRIMRLGYGPDELYTRSAQRSFTLWQDLFSRLKRSATALPSLGDEHEIFPLFYQTGVLWLARENDSYVAATLATFERAAVRFERLDRQELQNRYSQLELGAIIWGILEPDSGALMARSAVRAVAGSEI